MKPFKLIFSIFCLIFFSSTYLWGFNTKLKEEAIWKLPKVYSSHPRIFLRRDRWDWGPSVKDFKELKGIEPWKSWLKKIPIKAKPVELAIWYLFSNKEDVVPKIIKYLKKESYWPGSLTSMAICYDYIFNSPSFSEYDKRLVEQKMVQMAYQAIKKAEHYGDMWSHFGYPAICDLIMAGIALYGRREEAKTFLAYGGGYLKRNYLLGWKMIEGGWMGGWVYYRYSGIYLIEAIYAWSSATHENLFEVIQKKQKDWLRKHLYYLIQTLFPDNSPNDISGFSYSPYRPKVDLAILMITRAYSDPNGIKYLKDHHKNMNQWWWHGFNYLFWSFSMKNKNIDSYNLNLSNCWGKNSVGYVQMRSGWGKKDTIIEFKCGDYFWSHQFHNQNSFYIYKNGRLAIQSGIYDLYWGQHMLKYYRPTISSNSIIVIDPQETSWVPPKVLKNSEIKSQRGFYREFGGQRACYMLPLYGSAETCFTLKKYLWRKENQHHFERGGIEKFKSAKEFTYLLGNATKAYNTSWFSYPKNRPKVKLFLRELLFLDKKFFLVFDRIESTKASFEKRWLLHTIEEPKILSKSLKVEDKGHREIFDKGVVIIKDKDKKMYLQPLLPQKAFIRKVGGGATVSEVKRDPKNKGTIYLITALKGRLRRISPSLATDFAKKERWIIEFENPLQFKIYGSITGFDGKGSVKKDFLSKSSSIFIPKTNWKGKAYKKDKLYFSVTSVSSRFWVKDKNYPPNLKRFITIIKDGSKVIPGNWRIEIIPKEEKKFHLFLNFIYPCELSDKLVKTKIIARSNRYLAVSVANWILFFRSNLKPYKILKLKLKEKRLLKVLFLGLKEKTTYLISLAYPKSKKYFLFTSDKNGIIFVKIKSPCTITLEEK